MNDLEKEYSTPIDYTKHLNNFLVSQSAVKLINIFAVKLFGTEEENKNLTEQLELEAEASKIALRNREKGLVSYFDESLEPISQEFGCPHCGGFVYKYLDSHCESEGCDFDGKESIYCPKIKCHFVLKCQSTTLPLGCWVEEKKYDGSDYWTSKYQIGELYPIHFDNKTYTFKIINDDFDRKARDLIRKFFDYDLTRKEMNEYIILESINER